MYVIEVVPLTPLPPQVPQLLSYFFDRELPAGALVQVAVNTRKVPAVVVSCVPMEQQKIALKRSGFQLKKLAEVTDETPQVSRRQIKLAAWLSRFYYAPLGMSFRTVLPPFFGKPKYRNGIENLNDGPAGTQTQKPVLLLSRAGNVLENIRPYIKEALKSGGQALLMVPETTTHRYFFEKLKDDYRTAGVHSGLSNKEYFTHWQNAASGAAHLTVATRAGLFLPYRRLACIIVEDPAHEFYKSDMSPRYNAVEAAKKVAELTGAKLVLVSSLAPAGLHEQAADGRYELVDKKRGADGRIRVVDMVQELKGGNFSLLSRQLQQALAEALKGDDGILLYSARKAHSGILVCGNCGTLVNCQNCDIPMRVHKTSEKMLVCYRCSAYTVPPRRCANCQSSELKPRGAAGSQKIKEQLEWFLDKHQITGTDIFILDSDLIRTDEQEQEMLDAIAASSRPVVIATQMILSHRYRLNFGLIGVINADALMSNLDYRTDERFLFQMEKLRDFEPDNLMIQTYNPDNRAITAFAGGSYKEFYEAELASRKILGYPPFSRLIKLTFKHADQQKASFAARVLHEKLNMALRQMGLEGSAKLLGPSPAFIAREKGLYIYNVIIKLFRDTERPEPILKYVPSNWIIDADPRSVV